jgi:hypothetical protein
MTRQAVIAACAGLALVLGMPRGAAEAHEHVIVGEFEFVIGWVQEPPIVGERNGIDLFVAHVDEHEAEGEHDQEGITGLDASLAFAVEYGAVRREFPLRPVFGRPGAYTADLVPTLPGQYTFHLTGEVNGQPVEISVEPEEVGLPDAYAFPEPEPSTRSVVERLEAAESRQVWILVTALVGVGVGAGGLFLGLSARRR